MTNSQWCRYQKNIQYFFVYIQYPSNVPPSVRFWCVWCEHDPCRSHPCRSLSPGRIGTPTARSPTCWASRSVGDRHRGRLYPVHRRITHDHTLIWPHGCRPSVCADPPWSTQQPLVLPQPGTWSIVSRGACVPAVPFTIVLPLSAERSLYHVEMSEIVVILVKTQQHTKSRTLGMRVYHLKQLSCIYINKQMYIVFFC